MNRIDEFFRRKLSLGSEKASRQDIDDMAKLLGKQEGGNRAVFVWILLLLLIGSGTFAWLGLRDKKGDLNNSSSVETSQGQNTSQSNNQTKTVRDEQAFEGQVSSASILSSRDSATDNLEATNTSKGEVLRDGEQTANLKNDYNKNKIDFTSNKNQVEVNNDKKNKRPVKHKPIPQPKKVIAQPTSSTTENLIAKEGEKVNSPITFLPLTHITEARLDVMKNPFSIFPGQLIPSDSSLAKNKGPLKWSIRLGGGIAFFNELSKNYISDDNLELTNKATGSSFRLNLVRHYENWEFGTGLQYSGFQRQAYKDTITSTRFYFYETPEFFIDEQFHDPELYEKLEKYEGIYSLHTISLPLQVGYKFCSDSRLQVIPTAQININYAQQELLDFLEGGYSYYIEGPEYVTSLFHRWHMARIQGSSKITLGASASVELRFALSRRFYCSGLIGTSWLNGPHDERIPNSKSNYLNSFGEALIAFRF